MEKKRLFKRIALFLIVALVVTSLPNIQIWAKKTVKGVITATELYMRSGPGTDYKNITVGEEKVVLVQNQEVTIVGERDGWYHIKATFMDTRVEGYSLAQWITVTSGTVKTETGDFKEITPTPTPTPSPTPTPIPTAKGKVTATELYVRKGPGTDYENVLVKDEKAILVKDQAVTILGEKDGWYHITAKINKKKVEGYSSAEFITVTKGKVVNENEVPTASPEVSEAPTPSAEPDVTDAPDPTKKPSGDTPSPTENPEMTDIPQDTPFPTDMVNPLPSGAVITETGEIFDSEDNELEVVTQKYSSKYKMQGIVTADLLNFRVNADAYSEVIDIIYKDDIVSLVGSTTNYQVINGVERAIRWYKVIALVNGVPERGYVMSDYVRLNYSTPFEVTTRYSKQVLKAEPDEEAKNIKLSTGKKVKMTKYSKVMIYAEEQTESGKWFLVRGEYKDETVTGWIPEYRVKFDSNAKSIEVSYYKQKEKEAIITVTEAPSFTLTPTPTEQPNITDIPTPTDEPIVTGEVVTVSPTAAPTPTGMEITGDPEITPTPEITPPPKENVENPNAVIKNAAALSVKKEPKYAAAALFTEDNLPVFVYSGQEVRVIETSDDSENLWCKIELKFNNKVYEGYVNSIYIEADQSVDLSGGSATSNATTLSFEEALTAEGFPESYKPFLRELHAQYPSWKFKAFNTGLDWEEAVNSESVVGENLIPNTKGVEWKSLEAGAYSWKDDKFTVFDGSSWVTASKEAISYYMDPRNFLDHESIFQFEVLNYNPSYQNQEGIATILKNTAMNETSYTYLDELGMERSISYADTFAMAAEYSGVSPLHLASRVKQEVTLGKSAMSNSVTGTVSGLENLYNYYNIGAYHSTEAGGAIANGLRFARDGSSSEALNLKCLIPWNNRLRSILGGAFYIGNNYINRGQNTIYLQKFNMTSYSTYNHQYMANVEAPYSEGKRVFAAYENPEDIPIVFFIPVFLNMPENPCPVPEKAYNPNNWLKSLKLYDINGDSLSLTPTFSVTKDQEYNLIVDYETDYIKFKATTVSTLAKVLGEEHVYPEVGDNKVVIQVQAENGDIREYVINIVREEYVEPTLTPTPEVTETPVVTEAPTDTPVNTETPTPTETVTGAPSVTEPITEIPVVTEMPTEVPTEKPTPTEAPTEIPTLTEAPIPTEIPVETPTDTPKVTRDPLEDLRYRHGLTQSPSPTPEEVVGEPM